MKEIAALKRVSFEIGWLPDLPVWRTVEIAKKAEGYGFETFWIADELFYRDPWSLLAVIAANTRRIKLGPGVTHFIRPPPFIAQSLATLDELSDGRAVCAVGTGDIAMLERINFFPKLPLRRIREGIDIMRSMLEHGEVTYHGKTFVYENVVTSSRAVGRRIPIFIGAMGGPRSFRLAGQIADGVITALGVSSEYMRYVKEKVTEGARRAKRDISGFELAAWVPFSVASTSHQARDAIRPHLAYYAGALPEAGLSKHQVDPAVIQRIYEHGSKGDFDSAVKLVDDSIVDELSVSGTPDQIIDKIEKNFLKNDVRKIVLGMPDPLIYLTELAKPYPAPTIEESMTLVKERIMPYFSGYED